MTIKDDSLIVEEIWTLGGRKKRPSILKLELSASSVCILN